MKKQQSRQDGQAPNTDFHATVEAIKDAFARQDFDQADRLMDKLRETWRPEEEFASAGDA